MLRGPAFGDREIGKSGHEDLFSDCASDTCLDDVAQSYCNAVEISKRRTAITTTSPGMATCPGFVLLLSTAL
jgi:hypothetical protein